MKNTKIVKPIAAYSLGFLAAGIPAGITMAVLNKTGMKRIGQIAGIVMLIGGTIIIGKMINKSLTTA